MQCAMRSSTAVRAPRPSAARVMTVSRSRVVQVRASSTGQTFDRNWLKIDPLVFGAGFLGWTVPSSIPVSAFGGQSLFGLFNASIAENLARFPQGPALSDKFWLYLISWHVGLFVVLLLGQVGVQGRKQGYWS
mmetsp:Transcript_17329/g.29624  ORF Transcript_17329/g.29624 Transcript_17329/m.29624 type:complete len:133 (+) Transcript_17329:70-468(+)|eukprot:CAMPEP_0119106234 /NCGR_PEP_ID=MMETSP1180-20130426/3980_1 /TAXON_ID=3052 ORGANISM="Chlamydomonas cf sp, Strain CCMP681" /NCGR_SAMPLE_ID=MMETSP1180 /ASSEMBLY_ACC=CAM_ASM_000741 /LENGTH=132 /DNA_ID=CAMNT_0007091517 /DNA_START=86 /DNA_END=484 /DNA_ORIENTATION=+